MERMLVEVYPIQVVIYPKSDRDLELIRGFARNYIRYSEYWDKWRKQKVRIPESSYVFFTHDRREVRILRTMLKDFIAYLSLNNFNTGKDYSLEYKEINNVVDDVYPTIKEGWAPRGEQQNLIDFVGKFDEGMPLIYLVGGGGKSYTSMEIVSRKKERFVAIMRPTLIGEKSDEGWLKDFDKSFDISKDEIARVQGSDQLKKLIGICVTRGYNPYKAVLISNKTLMNFVKYYEEYPLEEFYNLGYRCTPMEFPKVLGVNTFVVDEAHFDHHLNCRFASYFGLKRLIGATATPNFDDKFADRMVKLLFPVEMRYTQLNNSIHIQPISFHYTLSNPNRVRVEGFRGYNHIKFEQSLYKRKGTEESYHEMIHGIIEKYHVPKYSTNPNFKCLITVASIDAAKNLSEYLSKIYTNKKVTSYVDKDPVDNLYSSDICVSTVGGAGTGHDIPDLATVIMTNAINSSTANLQCAWRLRKMDYEVEHSFIYLVCDSVQAHKNYDIKKKNITFKGKTLAVKNDYSNIVIPC